MRHCGKSFSYLIKFVNLKYMALLSLSAKAGPFFILEFLKHLKVLRCLLITYLNHPPWNSDLVGLG